MIIGWSDQEWNGARSTHVGRTMLASGSLEAERKPAYVLHFWGDTEHQHRQAVKITEAPQLVHAHRCKERATKCHPERKHKDQEACRPARTTFLRWRSLCRLGVPLLARRLGVPLLARRLGSKFFARLRPNGTTVSRNEDVCANPRCAPVASHTSKPVASQP